MICDSLQNASQYFPLHKGFEKAFRYLATLDPRNMPDAGTYEIDGKDVYASVQFYETLPPETLPWEAHRDYIDIQYVAFGQEMIGWADVNKLQPSQAYNPDKDVVKGVLNRGSSLYLDAGQFAVFFPQDAHMPKGKAAAVEPVIKVVVKVKC